MTDDDKAPDAQGAAELANAMAQLGAIMAPILEAAAGYRAAAMAMGFDDASAGQMAAQYHQMAMRLVTMNVPGFNK